MTVITEGANFLAYKKKKRINLSIHCDFGVVALDEMFRLALENHFGPPINVGYDKRKCFDEWWIEFDSGIVVSEGID